MFDVYIDGASAGNPGISGAGIWFKDEDGIVKEHAIPLGVMSNHQAEFEALVHALRICKELNLTEVAIRTDSKLVDDAIEKQYVKNPLFQPYVKEALALISGFTLFFIRWIPSKSNKHADQLARKAILKQKRH